MRLIALAPLALAACATTPAPDTPDQPERRPIGAGAQCNAEPVQYHIGHDATQAMGAAIQEESGASTLRWGPPDSAWTMDYRQDRVNVRYDRDMKITAITCG